MSSLYPLFIDLSDRKVVVIGGGNVAQRKVQRLLAGGANILLISPDLTETLEDMVAQNKIQVIRRKYQTGDLAGAWLVIASTNDQAVNNEIFAEANTNNTFCNVVDIPEFCSFHVPSLVQQGDLQIATSTGGASPALAREIRKQLQDQFGPEYQPFLQALNQLREHFKAKYPDDQPRRAACLETFVNSNALDLLRSGFQAEFDKLFEECKAQ